MKSTTASIDFAVCVLHGNEGGGCQRGHGAIRANWAAFLPVMKWREAELRHQVPVHFLDQEGRRRQEGHRRPRRVRVIPVRRWPLVSLRQGETVNLEIYPDRQGSSRSHNLAGVIQSWWATHWGSEKSEPVM